MMKSIVVSFALFAVCLAGPVPSEIQTAAATCGVPAIKPDVNGNIMGGKDAIPYSWPWQVALFTRSDDSPFVFKCSGSLIAPQWILTSAQCIDVKWPSDFRVKLGVFNNEKDDEPGELVLNNVIQFYRHPNYTTRVPPTFPYDIGLIKLEKPVEYTDHISPICLPEKKDQDLPTAGSSVFATGWGYGDGALKVKGNQGARILNLRQVTVPLIDQSTCKSKYFDPWYTLKDSMFCTGLEQTGKGTCGSDEGGPVVYQDPKSGAWTQVGITSWGNACDWMFGSYDLNTKVSPFIDWIEQYVKQ